MAQHPPVQCTATLGELVEEMSDVRTALPVGGGPGAEAPDRPTGSMLEIAWMSVWQSSRAGQLPRGEAPNSEGSGICEFREFRTSAGTPGSATPSHATITPYHSQKLRLDVTPPGVVFEGDGATTGVKNCGHRLAPKKRNLANYTKQYLNSPL